MYFFLYFMLIVGLGGRECFPVSERIEHGGCIMLPNSILPIIPVHLKKYNMCLCFFAVCHCIVILLAASLPYSTALAN